MSFSRFQLLRQSDGLVYTFDRRILKNGAPAYQRQDQDFWIKYHGPDLGWIAFDETGVYGITGRPWNTLPKDQSPDHPPAGIWISRKSDRSYVYDLVYLDPS